MSLADDMAADAASAPAPRAGKTSLSADMATYIPAAATVQGPDPSAGGSTLNIAGFDTGIRTPQWLDRGLSGAGKAVNDLGVGAGQIARSGLEAVSKGQVADKLGLPTTASVDEMKRRDAPLMNTGAGTAGYIAGNIAGTAIPLAGLARVGVPAAGALLNPTTYGAAAASGALNGALQPVGSDDNRSRNILAGAATGAASNAVVNGIGRIAQPVQGAVDAARQRAVQVLQNAGVPLDAAQLSGGTFLNKMRSSFSDNPFTASAQGELIGRQRQSFNNAVLNTIGENGPAATQDVMNRASTRINGVFHDVLNRNNVAVTDPLLNRISTIQQAANDEERHAVSNLANRLISHVDENGTIPGQAAYGVKKDLDRLASSPDTTLAYHARQLRTALMDGINDSLPQADRDAFAQARQQFRNMKQIEPAIDKEGAGNISPATLANVMGQKANRQASIYGRGNQDLVELAQSGKMLLGDKTPNSGTTARAAMQLVGPLAATALGGGYDAYNGDYAGALGHAALAGGAAILYPKAAQRLINNPATANFLSHGVQNMPLRNLLTLPQTNDAVGGTLRRLPGALLSTQ